MVYFVFFIKKVSGIVDSTCTNGLVGYGSTNNAADFCCPLECGACGGIGCGSFGKEFGLIGEDCCQSGIFFSQVFCSESESAPCIIESYIDDPSLYGVTMEEEDIGKEQTCSNGLPGYSSANNAAEFCCPLGCGYCGGVGCGSSGQEFGLVGLDCCQSGIFSTQVFCSESDSSPCIIESYLSDPSLYTTSIAQEDAGLSPYSSSASGMYEKSVLLGIMAVFGTVVSGFFFSLIFSW